MHIKFQCVMYLCNSNFRTKGKILSPGVSGIVNADIILFPTVSSQSLEPSLNSVM